MYIDFPLNDNQFISKEYHYSKNQSQEKTPQFDEYFSSTLCVSNIVIDLPKAFLNLRSFLWHLRGFLELRHPWGFSPEARRGSQGASRAAAGKSRLYARGEGVWHCLSLGLE